MKRIVFIIFCTLIIIPNVFCQLSWNKTIQFADITWKIKTGYGGPGPTGLNYWSDDTINNVRVDSLGQLHMKIRKVFDTSANAYKWYCSEIIALQSFGHGEYRFYVASNVRTFDENIVVGLFTFVEGNNNGDKEIDIEFHRFPTAYPFIQSGNGNYTVSPSTPSSHEDFELPENGDISTHKFIWNSSEIFFQSYHGYSPNLPGQNNLIHDWTYSGTNNPQPGEERLHLNFWLYNGVPPTNGQDAELIIKCVFVPPVGVTSPNGGEIWTGGHIHDITWNLPNITGNVKIELVRDNSYSTIAYNLPNSGLWQWLPISQYIENGDNYKIQISSISDPSNFDISDGNFTIVQAPELLSPISGSTLLNPVLLDWTTVLGATSYDLFLDGSLKTTTSQSEYTTTLNEGTHYWEVRSVSPDGYSIFSEEWSFVVNSTTCSSPNVIVNDANGTSPLTMTCIASGGSGGSYAYKWYSGTSCSGPVIGTNSTLQVTEPGFYTCKSYILGFEDECYSCDYGYANLNLPVIEVSGIINTNTTWDPQFVYLVNGDLTINSTLTIPAGTIVKFDYNSSVYSKGRIVVNGTLNLQGTSSNKVIFTSSRDDSYGGDSNGDGFTTSAGPGDWGYIKFNII